MKEQKSRSIKTAGYTLDHQVTRRRQQRRIDAETRAACNPRKSIAALRFRISCAGSEAELKDLLWFGASDKFQYASEKTRRAWASTAKKRLAFLKANLQNEKSVRK